MAQFNSDTARQAGEKSSRAGIPNKDISRREWIGEFLTGYMDTQFVEDFYSLSQSERIKIAVKLMEFDTAKIRAMQHYDTGLNEDLVIRQPGKPGS